MVFEPPLRLLLSPSGEVLFRDYCIHRSELVALSAVIGMVGISCIYIWCLVSRVCHTYSAGDFVAAVSHSDIAVLVQRGNGRIAEQ